MTFDHFVAGKDGFTCPREAEWIRKKGLDQIVIQTSSNNRYQNEDFQSVVEGSELLRQYESIRAIGFSMGCIGAIRLTQCMPVDSIFLVSPRMNDPFMKYVSVANAVPPTGVLFDPMIESDLAAAQLLLEVVDYVDFFSIKRSGHPASEGFRRANRLGGLLDYATSAPTVWAKIGHLIKVSPQDWRSLL